MTDRHPKKSEASVEERVRAAVFGLMRTIDVSKISVRQVVGRAKISRSTFYRYYNSVDDVVNKFEQELLETMHAINRIALKVRFSEAELEPTQSIIARMEVLYANREYILALNSGHGDPQFVHRATAVMHEYFVEKVRAEGEFMNKEDLYRAFVIAGHNKLIPYWLERRPDVSPEDMGALLNRLFYAVFFLDR